MDRKQKVSANGTYVFDAEDIELLDELSMTSMIAAAVGADQQTDCAETPAEDAHAEVAAPASDGDTTINQILRASPAAEEPRQPSDFGSSTLTEEGSGDLLSPDVLFPELTQRKNSGKS